MYKKKHNLKPTMALYYHSKHLELFIHIKIVNLEYIQNYS